MTFAKGLMLAASMLAGATAMMAPSATAAESVRRVAPVLSGANAVDDQSYARPLEARVTHVALDLEADMPGRRFSGTATLDILVAKDAASIILDTFDLEIASVTDPHGRPLQWSIGAKDPKKGAPLTILPGAARKIVIRYRSSPGARALQWLPAASTGGKRQPLLFSQGQPINNRSWIPTQDSPGIRQTWSARIVVPEALIALMSADRLTPAGEPAGPGKRAFRFGMDHPVPPYLIAIAIGDFAFRSLGPRTGVWSEPGSLDAAARELVDTEAMVDAAAGLYGPYQWGRYDMLVLPASFPAGGMENATLTFLTPTFITGDRANVDLIAHELAHSWSGNLVTNATWNDLWLNEGFTNYVENRIMERMYGKERADLEADLDWRSLAAMTARLMKEDPGGTKLFAGTDGTLPYLKGAAFLRTVEGIAGRDRFDPYLRGYFERHAFAPQTTAGFLADLRKYLVKGDTALEARLALDEWAFGSGLPANAVHPVSPRLAEVEEQRRRFEAGTSAASLATAGWGTKEWKYFLDGLARRQDKARLADLDAARDLSRSSNAYVRTAWLQLAIANRYDPARASITAFLNEVGRPLFIGPIYRDLLAEGEWGSTIARDAFRTAGPGYHPTVSEGLEKLLAPATAQVATP